MKYLTFTVTKFAARLISVIISALFAATVYSGQFNQVISIGDSLPAFEKLPATDGKVYSSSDFTESVLVLVSLSNTCPFSRGIEQDLIALVEQFKDAPVRIIGVNYNQHSQEQLSVLQERAKQKGYNFTYLRNDDQTLGRQLGTSVTPEFFVFNAERELIYTGLLHDSPAMEQSEEKVVYLRGEPSQFYVADAISAAQQSQAAPVQETKAYGCSVEYSNAN